MSSSPPPNRSEELHSSLFGRKYALGGEDTDLAAQAVRPAAAIRQRSTRNAAVRDGLASDGVKERLKN
jgi:hypothetical protein